MRRISLLLVAVAIVAVTGLVACGDGESSVSATGGAAGAAGADGGGTGGADGGQCYSGSFVSPADGATLSDAQDANHNCSDGITIDVSIATNAPDGTSATLMADGSQVATGTVSGAAVKFSAVQLKSQGDTKLSAQIGSDPNCSFSITVTSVCNGINCDISKPVLTATHPMLNGVPVAQGGDRASAAGQDYQAAFEVTTNIEDGEPVSLTVDGTADAVTTLAQGGVAKFAGVTLIPDGNHTVMATCTSKAGKSASSADVTYPVDTTPPDLTDLTASNGQFFGPSTDADPNTPGLQMRICGKTTAADALDLPASLGSGAKNYCVGIGTATPDCVAATSTGDQGGQGGCVDVTCPGGAPFDLTVRLTDEAGNPTEQTITGVHCASSLPSVQIIDPVDGTGTDVTKHILAASSTQQSKDQDAAKPGAQYTVVACTDAANGSGQLMAGMKGGTLANVGSPVTAVAATPADGCPSTLGYVMKFTNATLPESQEDSTGALTTPTEIQVQVTDASTAVGTSPAVDTWVDSIAPTLAEWSPNPLCGKMYQSATDVQAKILLASTNVPVTLTVSSNGVPSTYTATTLSNGFVTFDPVTFATGTNDVAATTTELSGNTGALKSPCTVTVGNPPIVTWTAPTASSLLNVSTDGDPNTPGWQGTLTVKTDVGGSGGTVQFSTDVGGAIGSPVPINASGVATLSGVTLPDANPIKITATTSNITGRGVGTASLYPMIVDTIAPGAPTLLNFSVKDRRATSFTLNWIAPSDNGANVAGYDVRVSRSPITAANFDAAEKVVFQGTPKAPGSQETLDVTGRLIETNYYFAVAAVDAGQNRSAILAAGPGKATFNTTILSSGTASEQIGYSMDGSSSINGDALTDLIVGGSNSNHVYIWFGTPTGYKSTPDVTITGPSSVRFGMSVAVVGDIDSDGMPDLAIGAPLDNSGAGRVYIFRGRTSWPASLNATQADYVIQTDPTADPNFASAAFGTAIARLGDFDGDGVDDFAIGDLGYNGAKGYVAVVRGVPAGSNFPAAISLPQDVGPRVIAIHGDQSVGGWFGYSVLGLGPYYGGGSAGTLVVGAPGPNSGKVYVFKGYSGIGSNLTYADAAEVYTGSATKGTGSVLSNLGSFLGSPALGVGTPAYYSTNGDARLFFGNSVDGVFGGSMTTLTDSAATAKGDGFGGAVFGGGFSGSTTNVSLIGSSEPDIVVSSLKEGGTIPANLYFIRGSKATVSGDVTSLADIKYPLPSDWLGASRASTALPDLNGDGYADIAIGEQSLTAGYPGRVLVLW